VVDYAFCYPPEYLVSYHFQVLSEFVKRGYQFEHLWLKALYRGKNSPPFAGQSSWFHPIIFMPFPEHDDNYLLACLENLRSKGVVINEEALHFQANKKETRAE